MPFFATDIGDRDSTASACVAVCIIVIAIISVLGNTVVIFVNATDPDLQTNVSNLLIINLAVTDLLNAVLVMVPTVVAVLKDEWVFGSVFCDIHCIFNYCLISVSMLTLAMISIDRGIAVRYPLHYAQKVTKKSILLAIGYTWMHGTIFAIVPSACKWVRYDNWEIVCTVSGNSSPSIVLYILLGCTICFLVPGAAIMIINIWIICFSQSLQKKTVAPVLRSTDSANNINMSDPSTGSSGGIVTQSTAQQFHHKKIVQSMFIVTVFFFICMTPFNLTKLIKVLGTRESIPPWSNVFSTVSQFFASAGNPFLYAIFRNDYRQAFKRFLRRFRVRIAQLC